MEQHVNTPPMNNPEQEIDLVEVIRKLWRNRKLILKVTVAFMILGVLVALFSAKEYTAGSTLVPQSSDKKIGGSLSGLAAMAGINLGDMTGGEVLSPKIYPKVLASIPFQKDIMYTRVKFEDFDEPVTVLDYYTNEEYQRFSLGKTIVKYTIGLPGVILKAIRGEQPEPEFSGSAENQIQSLSKDEKKCIDILKDKINLNLNEKDGYVQLSVDMPDAWSAAQLAERYRCYYKNTLPSLKLKKYSRILILYKGVMMRPNGILNKCRRKGLFSGMPIKILFQPRPRLSRKNWIPAIIWHLVFIRNWQSSWSRQRYR
nr:Wzz/FepE/Etk N-terminal domain-containing protein [Odoribacter sp. OF09-27XD]